MRSDDSPMHASLGVKDPVSGRRTGPIQAESSISSICAAAVASVKDSRPVPEEHGA